MNMNEVARRLHIAAKELSAMFTPSYGFVLILMPLASNLEGKATMTSNINDPGQVKAVLQDTINNMNKAKVVAHGKVKV